MEEFYLISSRSLLIGINKKTVRKESSMESWRCYGIVYWEIYLNEVEKMKLWYISKIIIYAFANFISYFGKSLQICSHFILQVLDSQFVLYGQWIYGQIIDFFFHIIILDSLTGHSFRWGFLKTKIYRPVPPYLIIFLRIMYLTTKHRSQIQSIEMRYLKAKGWTSKNSQRYHLNHPRCQRKDGLGISLRWTKTGSLEDVWV